MKLFPLVPVRHEDIQDFLRVASSSSTSLVLFSAEPQLFRLLTGLLRCE